MNKSLGKQLFLYRETKDKENYIHLFKYIKVMEFLTNEKLTIVGAAGMIGSNMAQTAIMMHLDTQYCLYDRMDQD